MLFINKYIFLRPYISTNYTLSMPFNGMVCWMSVCCLKLVSFWVCNNNYTKQHLRVHDMTGIVISLLFILPFFPSSLLSWFKRLRTAHGLYCKMCYLTWSLTILKWFALSVCFCTWSSAIFLFDLIKDRDDGPEKSPGPVLCLPKTFLSFFGGFCASRARFRLLFGPWQWRQDHELWSASWRCEVWSMRRKWGREVHLC